MKTFSSMVIIIFFAIFASHCNAENINKEKSGEKESKMSFEIQKVDEEWHKSLSPEEFRVLREKGTEKPFSGKYNLNFEDGVYYCKGCGNPLFVSDSKFESSCGWPSFSDVKDTTAIKEITDTSFGMVRTEIVCGKCGGHLGHVFDDGPNPTGLRYCINSVSIDFKSTNENKDGKK